AARLPGSLVADAVGGPGAPGPDGPRAAGGADLRIGTPSGVVTARAVVTATPSGPHAESASLLRTARPLMRGQVAVPRF
ncbi:hypothetical protein KFZ73_26675, partial [Tsukamurella paurometabola]|nr:hypothetical protein [Tsukamurella paurometabola]